MKGSSMTDEELTQVSKIIEVVERTLPHGGFTNRDRAKLFANLCREWNGIFGLTEVTPAELEAMIEERPKN